MKTAKILLLMTCAVAAQVGVLQAQGQGGGIDFKLWTPATILSVGSVVFSFGIAWQTLRVQGQVLKALEQWQREHVDPTLRDHGELLAKLDERTGKLAGRR